MSRLLTPPIIPPIPAAVTPGGPDTAVQTNHPVGTFHGDAGFLYNGTGTATLGSATGTGILILRDAGLKTFQLKLPVGGLAVGNVNFFLPNNFPPGNRLILVGTTGIWSYVDPTTLTVPAGPAKAVQYNSSPAGTMSGDDGFTYLPGGAVITLGSVAAGLGIITFFDPSTGFSLLLSITAGLTQNYQWNLPTGYPAGNGYLVTANMAGTISYTNPASVGAQSTGASGAIQSSNGTGGFSDSGVTAASITAAIAARNSQGGVTNWNVADSLGGWQQAAGPTLVIGQTGTPSNVLTVASWFKLNVGGFDFWFPLYQ